MTRYFARSCPRWLCRHSNGPARTRHAAPVVVYTVAIVSPGLSFEAAGHGVRSAWRLAKVLDYANDPTQAYAIDARMKKLGRGEVYAKELARLPKAEGYQRDGPGQSKEAARH